MFVLVFDHLSILFTLEVIEVQANEANSVCVLCRDEKAAHIRGL